MCGPWEPAARAASRASWVPGSVPEDRPTDGAGASLVVAGAGRVGTLQRCSRLGRRLWLEPGRLAVGCWIGVGQWIGISRRPERWLRGRGSLIRRRRCRCSALSSDRLRGCFLAAITGWGVSHVVPQRRPDDFHAPFTAGPSGKLRARHHLVYPGGVDPRNVQLYADPGWFRQLRPCHTAKVPGMAGPEAQRHRPAFEAGLTHPGARRSSRTSTYRELHRCA